MIIALRIRGQVRIPKKVECTLKMLRLYNKNYCVLVKNSPQLLGMIKKVKDYITYGEVEDDIVNELYTKRGTLYTGRTTDSKKKINYSAKYVEWNNKKYNRFFRLSPPVKGYGRKGIKKTYVQGGALGNRGKEINALIKRMI